MPSVLRPAVFLERDGTLNERVFDEAHGIMCGPRRPEELALKRGAGPFVRALNDLGFLCLVVTDQPAIAKGVTTIVQLDRVHRRLREALARWGARLDGIFFCPHHPDPGAGGRQELGIDCSCRKPAPGLVLEAASIHYANLDRSFMLGARLNDIEAGRAAGVTTILLCDSSLEPRDRIARRPEARPDHIVSHLDEALALIRGARERVISEHHHA